MFPVRCRDRAEIKVLHSPCGFGLADLEMREGQKIFRCGRRSEVEGSVPKERGDFQGRSVVCCAIGADGSRARKTRPQMRTVPAWKTFVKKRGLKQRVKSPKAAVGLGACSRRCPCCCVNWHRGGCCARRDPGPNCLVTLVPRTPWGRPAGHRAGDAAPAPGSR